MSERPDWFQLIAAKRGKPDGWKWFHSEWRGEVMLVKGGVAGHVYQRGPNKGKPNPSKRTDVSEMAVSRADMDAIQAEWSAQTGKCHGCYGTGKEVCGWSKETGPMTRDCRKCSATGAAHTIATHKEEAP